MKNWWLVLAISPLIVTASPSRGLAQRLGDPGLRYMRSIGLAAAQIDSVDRGLAVVRSLESGNDREVAVIGAIRLDGTPAFLRARALDVSQLISANGGTFHSFASPATESDVATIQFDPSEYRALRACRPADCQFKLPASVMHEFAERIDWNSSRSKREADELLRSNVLQLAAAYRARGNAALQTYDDLRSVRPGSVFTELVARSPEFYEYAPALQQYLDSYPAGRPASARDVLYWSEFRLPHLRPLLTVNHIVVYQPGGAAAFVARKQIYASHYFEGAFELVAVVNAAEPDGVYLFALRRFRFDNLPAGAMNVRGRVRQELVNATRNDLERERKSLAGAATH